MAQVNIGGNIYEVDVPGLSIRLVGPRTDPVPVDPEPEVPPEPTYVVLGRRGATSLSIFEDGTVDLSVPPFDSAAAIFLLDEREEVTEPIQVVLPDYANQSPFLLYLVRNNGNWVDSFEIAGLAATIPQVYRMPVFSATLSPADFGGEGQGWMVRNPSTDPGPNRLRHDLGEDFVYAAGVASNAIPPSWAIFDDGRLNLQLGMVDVSAPLVDPVPSPFLTIPYESRDLWPADAIAGALASVIMDDGTWGSCLVLATRGVDEGDPCVFTWLGLAPGVVVALLLDFTYATGGTA